MPALRTSTLSINYADAGSGDVVVLVHGWPDAARGWHDVRSGLLADSHRVVVPDLRGCGQTSFLDSQTVRDGSAAALAQDVLDLTDALQIDSFAVVGHDWGARAAYTLAAVAPQRVTSITALALAYQPRGEFVMPPFRQARLFWYQWLMYVDAGIEAITNNPIGFAREQWQTWSPPGWFDDSEFAATAAAFANPDWVPITLNNYRSRFSNQEPRDPRYDTLRDRIALTDRLDVPTLMIQGGSDSCDPPEASEGLDDHFTDYRRAVVQGAGHFPHREAPDAVLDHLRAHLSANP